MPEKEHAKSLAESMDVRVLQMLQDSFATAAGVSAIICEPGGDPVTSLSRGSEFCRFLTRFDATRRACLEHHVRAAREAVTAGEEGQTCYAGITLLSAPIRADGRTIGVIVAGVGPEKSGFKQKMLQAAARFGLDARAVTQMSKTLAHRTERDLAPVRRMTRILADAIASLFAQSTDLDRHREELSIVSTLTAVLAGTSDLAGMLDTVARHIVRTMGVKGCILRLVDPSGQELRIAAVCNLSRDYLRKGSVKIEESSVDRQALRGEPVYVEDMQTDSRVLYPQDARREGLASGLAVGMVYRATPVGVIHVYTGRRYRFSPSEIATLQTIATLTAGAILSARYHEQALQNEQVRQQVRWAAEVQRRMLPSHPPEYPDLEIAAEYVPCFELAGDFYDFIELPDANLGIVVSDVSGKGVPASLLMASTRSALRAHADSIYSLSEILRRINVHLCSETRPSEFVTMFYGVLDRRTGDLTYANAGHDAPILLRDGTDGSTEMLKATGVVLGLDPHASYQHSVVRLDPGDMLVLYTDGLTDAVNFHNKFFGRPRLLQAVFEARGRPADVAAKHVLWQMRRFVGLAEQFDDISLVVLRLAGRAPAPPSKPLAAEAPAAEED